MIRAFIAIALPESTRTALDAFAARLRKDAVRARWVNPEAMHLTLCFLGDISPEQTITVRAYLRDACRAVSGPALLTRGIGAFPSLRKPSVFWAGVETLEGDLAAVQRVAASCAQAVGIPPDDKAFHAHVTLARIRKRQDAGIFADALTPYLDTAGALTFGHEFKAANVVLFSSTLTRRGPVYRPVEEFSLL